MFKAFLVTTSSEGLRALGQREQRSYELISDSVRDRLGDRHAALFGEPVPTAHGDQYDWYAPVLGKADRLSALAPTEQDAARLVLDGLVADIAAEAERLKNSRNLADLRLGEALDNALRVPGDDHIYVVRAEGGLQPVLVNWAWVGDEQRAVRGVLTGADRRMPVAAAAPVAAASTPEATAAMASAPVAATSVRTGWGWWWWLIGLGWLLLALMIAAIIILLIRPCGLNALPWLNFCPTEQVVEAAQTQQLENQIMALERQIAEADRACQPPPVVASEPAQSSAADDELDERMNRHGATRGELTFTLSWNSVADIDLHVTCPANETVMYRRRNVCGGTLDVDSNAGSTQTDPIENIYFESAADGTYSIAVNLYALQGANPDQPFTLTIQDGDWRETLEGHVSRYNEDWSTTYNRTGQP